ncbi:MAG: ATP-binding protein [Nitrososphaeria archaeon]
MEYYPRKIEEELDKWADRKEVILIRGPRQSGKTTLFMHLREKYGGEYVTLEDQDALFTFDNAPRKFAERYLTSGKVLFLDEAQYSRNAGRNIKLMHDLYPGKLYVTGSGSFDIKVEVGKYLVGRAVYMELLPLSFEEFIMWKARDLHGLISEWKRGIRELIAHGAMPDLEPAFPSEFKSLLEEYIIFGGFPGIVKEDSTQFKVELLKNLVRTYLEKDVFFFFNVREMEKFRSLLSYLSLTSGSLLELSSPMRDLHMDYRTIESYLSVLVSTYIVSLVAPFHRNSVNELKKSKKVYFTDTGLRNGIMGNFLPFSKRTDAGSLLENFVFNELKNMGFDVHYWRTTGGAEVDFVVKINDQLVPIEVKCTGREKRGFISFIKEYSPRVALVFTEVDSGIREVGNTKVAYLPHYVI